MTYEKAVKLRQLINTVSQSLDDQDALDGAELFDVWRVNTDYAIDTKVRYKGKLYRCVQAHKSQDDYMPDIVPALWTEIAPPSEEWPAWKQPLGSHDSYAKGAKVSHNNLHWISDIDANVYEPGVACWTEQSMR